MVHRAPKELDRPALGVAPQAFDDAPVPVALEELEERSRHVHGEPEARIRVEERVDPLVALSRYLIDDVFRLRRRLVQMEHVYPVHGVCVRGA